MGKNISVYDAPQAGTPTNQEEGLYAPTFGFVLAVNYSRAELPAPALSPS